MLFKKYPKLEEINVKESWTVGQGATNGNPFFIRINKGCDEICGHPELNTRIGIAIPFDKEADNGYPSEKQTMELNEIEDGILNIIDKNHKTILAFCITGIGFREFVFYSAEPNEFDNYLKVIKNINSSYEYQHYLKEDKKWRLYKQFSRGL